MSGAGEVEAVRSTWHTREDWLRDHLGSDVCFRVVSGGEELFELGFVCNDCGALVISRHAHAEWHMKQEARDG